MSSPGHVKIGERAFKLGPVRWAILKRLVVANGEPVTRQMIRRDVYRLRSEIEANGIRRPKDPLSVHLYQIRKKLRGSGVQINNRYGGTWFLVREYVDAKAST